MAHPSRAKLPDDVGSRIKQLLDRLGPSADARPPMPRDQKWPPAHEDTIAAASDYLRPHADPDQLAVIQGIMRDPSSYKPGSGTADRRTARDDPPRFKGMPRPGGAMDTKTAPVETREVVPPTMPFDSP